MMQRVLSLKAKQYSHKLHIVGSNAPNKYKIACPNFEIYCENALCTVGMKVLDGSFKFRITTCLRAKNGFDQTTWVYKKVGHIFRQV